MVFNELSWPRAWCCSQHCSHGAEELLPGEIGQQRAPQYSTGKVCCGAISLMLVLKQAVGQAAVPCIPLSTHNCLYKRLCYSVESGFILWCEFEIKVLEPASSFLRYLSGV